MAFVGEKELVIRPTAIIECRRPRVTARKTIYEMLARLTIGQQIPAERQLAQDLSLSRKTIRAVLAELEKQQVVRREQGRGTFLSNRINPAKNRPVTKMTIGAILPDLKYPKHPMIAQIVKGIESASEEAGLSLRLWDTGHSVASEIDCLRNLARESIKGLIVYPFGTVVYEPEFLDLIRRQICRGSRIVMVDRYLPEIDTCSVSPDYYRGGYIAYRHLIILGHRRILNLSNAKTSGTTGVALLRGSVQALRDYAIPVREELIRERQVEHDFIESGYHILKEFLAGGKDLPFTAIYCACEGSAYGAYTALKEHNLRVPEDIAIVSSDNVNMPEYDIGWTTVTYPWEEIGRKVVALLNNRITGTETAEQQNEHIILPVNLTIRKSCGMYQGTPDARKSYSSEILKTVNM